ncbi:MAG: hypothetical protein KA780_03635 [Prolixibacteraceae bacterium]|nr:hypothetical protein [Prolixibacteraceae bacterium]NLX29436.1 hypothetical protein [Bacteroidales bacterium]HOY50301.1 hypothetical protein [Prolixibacteraceae bacterium]
MQKMISYNTGRTFPPTVVFAGTLILLAGLLSVTRVTGILMVLTGAFLLFSTDKVRIHPGTGKISSGTSLFGIISTGKQRNLKAFRGLAVVPYSICTTTHSLSNRSNSVQEREFRVYLVERIPEQALLVRKFLLAEEAFAFARQLSSILEIPLVSENQEQEARRDHPDSGAGQEVR